MQIYRHWRDVPSKGKGAVVAIGNFDGVHLGHQAVIKIAKKIARDNHLCLAVLTFEPHPREFFGNNNQPFRLTPFRIKLRQISALGIDILYLLRFYNELASMNGDNFIQRVLIEGLGVKHVVVGYDFAFGRGRSGNVALLEKYAGDRCYQVTQVRAAKSSAGVYSASLARELLLKGEIEELTAVLGRLWEFESYVRHGEQRGRKIGFRTANLIVSGKLFPRHGVYAVWAALKNIEKNCWEWWPAVANLGCRPTFGLNQTLLEVHLIGFNKDIYGERLRVCFAAHIRAEKKFSGIDSLKQQIKRDTECAYNLLNHIDQPEFKEFITETSANRTET